MYARCVRHTVNRRAWFTTPEFTSSKRASPGKIGSPAASAEVQVSGRSAFELRLNRAPPPAVHPDPTASLLAWYSSYNWHAPDCTTSEWASDPASIGAFAGNG